MLRGLIGKRDAWIYFYQNLELRLNGEITNLKHFLSEIEGTIRPNLLGYISQNGKATGYYPDRWIGPSFEAGVKAHRPVSGLSVEVRMAQGLSRPAKIQFLINEKLATESVLQAGQHAIVNVPCSAAAQEDFTLAIRSDAYFCPQQMGINSDERHLVCLVEYITAQH